MYSGSTLTNFSGAILGAHQKIDRTAYKHLEKLIKDTSGFPDLQDILHFEGKNGPDGIKRKSPARDEPWHFYAPFDDDDTRLIIDFRRHYKELVVQLKKGTPTRAAYDAAWLAHTIVDGLTPAHHFPYEEKLAELRGEGMHTRDSVKDKLLIPGDTFRLALKNNWKMWGPDGLMSMHGLFEMGVAVMIAPLKFKTALPSEANIKKVAEIGIEEWFARSARHIAMLDMYDRFCTRGWTLKLVRDVRNELAPTIIKTVALAWYSAMRDAGTLRGKK
ncbi:MAG: hypothetical protein M3Q70_01525 [bacterium]|nr:hypothetical protein [bacterium]